MSATVRLVASTAVRVAIGLCLAWTLAPSEGAADVKIGKTCSSKPVVAPGEFLDCVSSYEWAATPPPLTPETVVLRVTSGQDVADTNGDGVVFPPGVGDCTEDLATKVKAVIGNAACSPGNVLPCIVCQGGQSGSDGGLSCPGPAVPLDGRIEFAVNECRAPSTCAEDPGIQIKDRSDFDGVNQRGDDRGGFAASSTTCIGVPTIEKVCTPSADPQVTVNYTDVPTGCVIEDELFRALPTCPIVLPARSTGESLGSQPAPAGDGVVNFDLPADLTTPACNVARLVCNGVPVLVDDEPVVDGDDCEFPGGYKCYTAKLDPRGPRFSARDVTLEDQFQTKNARVLRPYELCTPLSNPEAPAHLMCYKIIDDGPRGRRGSNSVLVTDQYGTEQMVTANGRVLCLPAIKNCDPEEQSCREQLAQLEEQLNHFQCYAARTQPGFDPVIDPADPLQVELTDQFETKSTDLSRSVFVCNPTAKTFDSTTTGIVDPTGHLKCYDADDSAGQPRFTGRTVSVDDQFGTWDVRIGKVSHVCEPATKERLSTERSR